jgi:hypothetical protein
MVPELRPRGIGEMLDAAVSLYRSRWRQLFKVTVFVVVPIQILNSIVLLSAEPTGYRIGVTGSPQPVYDAGHESVALAATLIALVLPLLATAFVQAVSTRIVADAYTGRPDPVRAAVSGAQRRLGAVLGLAILVALADGLGLAFCIVGYVVPLTWFAVAVPVLILERAGVGAAMGRSFNLTKSHFFRVLGLVLSVQLLTIVLNVGLAAAVNLILHHGGGAVAAIVTEGIANSVANTITWPFVAAAILVCYFDLRIRDEGFDVQLLMQSVDDRHAASRAALVPPAAG